MPAIVEVAGLTKSYGGSRGVVDLTFRLEGGEVFGYLGPNGAGKTTTIRLLMGLLRPDAGNARIGGLDCWAQSVEVKRLVGYLPGEFTLDPNLTGGQILEYFANLRGGVEWPFVRQLVERLDLDPSRRFRHYSRGNKQKVGLVQAFMHRPRLVVLDEPTSGLDPINQHEFERIVEEVRSDGRTVFLSSHVLGEVERLCDRVGIIRDGRLVQMGSVHALRELKVQQVEIQFNGPYVLDAFRRIPGVKVDEAEAANHSLRLSVRGDLDSVVKTAAQFPVAKLTSHEPGLEEVFLRYFAPADESQQSGNSPPRTT